MPNSDDEGWGGPIYVAKDGSYGYDFKVALAQWDLEERARRDAMADLARLGVLAPRPPAAGATPRDAVLPPTMPGMVERAGPASPSHVGDIPGQLQHPGERYWETLGQGRARPDERAVAKRRPPHTKCPPPGQPPYFAAPIPAELEPYRALIENCLAPVVDQVMKETVERTREMLRCRTIFTQPTTWLAPPITALTFDLFTAAAGVTLTAGAAAPTTILTTQVPDRFVVVLQRFANELEAPGAFADVRWSNQRNRAPLRSYGNFDVQLGVFTDPTRFSAPLILNGKEEYRLIARNTGAADHTAFARLMGWAFAVRSTSADGSYDQFHTM